MSPRESDANMGKQQRMPEEIEKKLKERKQLFEDLVKLGRQSKMKRATIERVARGFTRVVYPGLEEIQLID